MARRTSGNYGSNGLRTDGTSFNVGNQLGDRPSIRLFSQYNSGSAMAAILSGQGGPDPEAEQGQERPARSNVPPERAEGNWWSPPAKTAPAEPEPACRFPLRGAPAAKPSLAERPAFQLPLPPRAPAAEVVTHRPTAPASIDGSEAAIADVSSGLASVSLALGGRGLARASLSGPSTVAGRPFAPNIANPKPTANASCGAPALAWAPRSFAPPAAGAAGAGAAPDSRELNELFVARLSRLRAQPSLLIPLLDLRIASLDGSTQTLADGTRLRTVEGAAALHEAKGFALAQAPVGPLVCSLGLRRAAADLAEDLGETGRTDTTASDGSEAGERVARYGTWRRARATVLYCGSLGRPPRATAAAGAQADGSAAPPGSAPLAQRFEASALDDALVSLVVDDGDAARSHRTLLFSPSYSYAGCAAAAHKKYGHVLVLELAGEYMDDHVAISLRERTEKYRLAGGELTAAARAAGAASEKDDLQQQRPRPQLAPLPQAPPSGAAPASKELTKMPHIGTDFCVGCGLPILGGRVVVLPASTEPTSGHADGLGHQRQMHDRCFTCARCKCALAERPYRKDRPAGSAPEPGKPDSVKDFVCEPCWEEHHAPRCAACALPVSDTILGALNKSWHPACFACGECRTALGDDQKFFEGRDGGPVCETCANVQRGIHAARSPAR